MMPTQQLNGGGASALPFYAALALLPSLPRPVLVRLVTRMIEHIDLLDGDPEDEEDTEDMGDEEISDPENAFVHVGYEIDQSAGPL